MIKTIKVFDYFQYSVYKKQKVSCFGSSRRINLDNGFRCFRQNATYVNGKDDILFTIRFDTLLCPEENYPMIDYVVYREKDKICNYTMELTDKNLGIFQRISVVGPNDFDVETHFDKKAPQGFKPYTDYYWRIKRDLFNRITYISEKVVTKGKIINQEENMLFPDKNKALHIQRNDRGYEEVSWINADQIADTESVEKLLS